MTLSGIKDVDMKIIDKLDDNELIKVCQVNKYVKSLCDMNIFWINRMIRIYPVDGKELAQMKEYLSFPNYKELYIWLKKEFDVTNRRNRGASFDAFKNNLVLNTSIEKIVDLLSKKWTQSWINKKEFSLYIKRLLFKVLRYNNGRVNDVTDNLYEIVLNYDLPSMHVNTLIAENFKEIFP